MKISPSVFPVVVMVVGICWLGARQREMQGLRDGMAEMTERRFANAAVPFGSRDAGGRTAAPVRANMRRLAKSLEEWGGAGWLRTNWGEMDELEKMDWEELIALLDAMAETDVEKGRIERRVLDLLEKIDPEYVTRRTGRESALGEWGRVDPAGAVAWFEEQVAAGTFKRPFLMRKNLVWGLGESDPAAAHRLKENLPEESRAAIFEKGYTRVGLSTRADNLPTMGELMRALVPK